MIHSIAVWLLVAGFAGAGLVNAIGTERTRSDFQRWGYPRGWGIVTGAAEVVSAGLIALPVTRDLGLIFGAAIIAAGVLTVLRHHDVSHLVPLGLFTVLLGVAAALP